MSDSYSSLLKELEIQKTVLALENSSNMVVGYRHQQLQVPTYACYMSCAKYSHAGENSIRRYCEATGFTAQIICVSTEVGNVDCFNRDLTLPSRKMAILPFQIPNCNEQLLVPFRVLEESNSKDIPLRLGMEVDGIVATFAKNNKVKCLPENCLLLIQAGYEYAWRKINVPKCGLCFDMDPYPRDSVFSKIFQGRLLEQLTLEEITGHLKRGIIYVEFLYSDQSAVRKMYCTKADVFIPTSIQPKTANPNRFDSKAIRAFDVEKSEWRSFKMENVLKIRIKRDPYNSGPDMLDVVARKCSDMRRME